MTEASRAESGQQANERLQLAYWQALELANFKGGFLARTAHELRSPLNKIISLQQMIIEGLCDDGAEEREFITEAHAAAMKLLEYLDFLIQVAKIQAGRSRPQLETVSLTAVLQQVEAMMRLPVADRNLRLVVAVPDAALRVTTDPTWLRSALITLIAIALDSSDRGTIHLHLAPTATPAHCHLWLDDDRPSTHWQESLNLPLLEDFDLQDTLSASLRMAMVEAMLTAMGGSLTLVAVASDTTPNRLQLTLPLEQSGHDF
ncbi:MAG TPA: HAMP domain-containing sensor histidine kinase [Candidatus Obscuribacterales bacterium]